MSEKLLRMFISKTKVRSDEWHSTRGRRFFVTKKAQCARFYSLLKIPLYKKKLFSFFLKLITWKWLLATLVLVVVGVIIIAIPYAIKSNFLSESNFVPCTTSRNRGRSVVTNNQGTTTTVIDVPIQPKQAVVTYSTVNHDKQNSWFRLKQITINLTRVANDYVIDVPLDILRKLPNGHTGWKCTYVFGSEQNEPNSCQSTNHNFFSNNCFHLTVPESVFFNQKDNTTKNIYCKISVNFTIWDTVRGQWINWDFYDLTTRIDYGKLINDINRYTVTATTNSALNYHLVSSFTIKNGKLVNIVEKVITFRFQEFIVNYRTRKPLDVTIPNELNVKSIAGSIATQKIPLFAFSDAALAFTEQAPGKYFATFRNQFYYDLTTHCNYQSRTKNDYYVHDYAFFYNYLVGSNFFLLATVFIASFVNLTFTFAIHICLKSIFQQDNAYGYVTHRYTDNITPNSDKATAIKIYNYDNIRHLID